MTQRVLGLDIATACGWAVMEKPYSLVECGLIISEPKRYESQGMRYIKYERALREIIAVQKPTIVAFETWGQSHSSKFAAEVLHSLLTLTMKVAEEHGLPYFDLSVQAIKVHATGDRCASKEKMVISAQRLWPAAKITDHNIADSLHVARLALTRI